MHLKIGELSFVIISSPDAAKQVMKTHDVNFASRPSIFVAEIATYGCKSITFVPYGEYWRQLRKICTTELLSMKRVQSFRSIREKVTQDLVQWIASNEGRKINLTEKIYSSTIDVVSRASFGKKAMEKERLVSTLQQLVTMSSGFNIVDLYPSVKLLQVITGLSQKVMKLHRITDRILEDIIEEHRVANVEKIDDGSDKYEEDLVDVLLRFQNEGDDLHLTTNNIKAVLFDIMAAGTDTSGTTLDWAMVEMLRNPSILKKAQNEVRKVFDKNGYVDESCLAELKYLKAVINESLRLHPPAPLLLPRKSSEQCEINGYDIPSGTKVIVNAWAINRDPKYWINPECFNPDRFIDSSVDYKGNSFEYIPFGAGRRICPGILFGLANVELPLAKFLYHFDWELGDGMGYDEMDMTEEFGMTTRRKKDLFVVPIIARPLSGE